MPENNGAFESIALNMHGRCPKTMWNILLHCAPPTWMVVVVGFTHMVLIFVSDRVLYRIIVFEGDTKIRLKVLDWMQTGRPMKVYKRNTKRIMEVSSSNKDASGSISLENATTNVDARYSISIKEESNVEKRIPTNVENMDIHAAPIFVMIEETVVE